MTDRTCVAPECESATRRRDGLCEVHRRRMERHGNLDGIKPHGPPTFRFARYFDSSDPEGCWEWTGARHSFGYGVFSPLEPGRKTVLAHRFAYEQAHGPIPDGMFVCHRCDNPPCCNPAHLFLGTHSDNMQDMTSKGRNATAESCAAGHPWTEESTRPVMVNGRATRRCRICRREKAAAL